MKSLTGKQAMEIIICDKPEQHGIISSLLWGFDHLWPLKELSRVDWKSNWYHDWYSRRETMTHPAILKPTSWLLSSIRNVIEAGISLLKTNRWAPTTCKGIRRLEMMTLEDWIRTRDLPRQPKIRPLQNWPWLSWKQTLSGLWRGHSRGSVCPQEKDVQYVFLFGSYRRHRARIPPAGTGNWLTQST